MDIGWLTPRRQGFCLWLCWLVSALIQSSWREYFFSLPRVPMWTYTWLSMVVSRGSRGLWPGSGVYLAVCGRQRCKKKHKEGTARWPSEAGDSLTSFSFSLWPSLEHPFSCISTSRTQVFPPLKILWIIASMWGARRLNQRESIWRYLECSEAADVSLLNLLYVSGNGGHLENLKTQRQMQGVGGSHTVWSLSRLHSQEEKELSAFSCLLGWHSQPLWVTALVGLWSLVGSWPAESCPPQ